MRKSLIDRLFLPTVLSLTTVVFALVILQRLLTQQQAEVQASTNAQALLVKSKMESELKARVLPLELLRERWEASNHLDFVKMESDAVLALSGYHAYQAAEWVDPKFHVRWVVPREGNEADLGADLGSDEQRRAALQEAKISGGVMVTRSVDLRQGGRGVLVCLPGSDPSIGGCTGAGRRYRLSAASVARPGLVGSRKNVLPTICATTNNLHWWTGNGCLDCNNCLYCGNGTASGSGTGGCPRPIEKGDCRARTCRGSVARRPENGGRCALGWRCGSRL